LSPGDSGVIFARMSTLAEIERAAEALPPEEKQELIRFLNARTHSTEAVGNHARLVKGPSGTLLLEAPLDAPP
jgi:hypothetical protein